LEKKENIIENPKRDIKNEEFVVDSIKALSSSVSSDLQKKANSSLMNRDKPWLKDKLKNKNSELNDKPNSQNGKNENKNNNSKKWEFVVECGVSEEIDESLADSSFSMENKNEENENIGTYPPQKSSLSPLSIPSTTISSSSLSSYNDLSLIEAIPLPKINFSSSNLYELAGVVCHGGFFVFYI
jgi:hypothetical protein